MKWADYKRQITALNSEEIEQIELVAQLITQRKKLGLTQRELADRSGLKQSAIARLEREGNIPRLDTLEKISKAMGLKVALIDEDSATKEYIHYQQ
ncbi:helix-turn-helix transcriptional regulator [Sutcliffiella cohnii]|uniref:helix-turn-helix domain-containing protein n=1 Tax=Sutcliffiella cohnii TaxID=33932 RepID=UPI002E2344C9|nr:helix-turn-helix transcriptional regulator [Sutcliffiella cohnii]